MEKNLSLQWIAQVPTAKMWTFRSFRGCTTLSIWQCLDICWCCDLHMHTGASTCSLCQAGSYYGSPGHPKYFSFPTATKLLCNNIFVCRFWLEVWSYSFSSFLIPAHSLPPCLSPSLSPSPSPSLPFPLFLSLLLAPWSLSSFLFRLKTVLSTSLP